MKESVIIFGINNYSMQIRNNLIAAQIKPILCDNDRERIIKYSEEQEEEAFYLSQANLEILKEKEIEKVHAILINIEDDSQKLIYAINIRKKYPNLKIVAAIENTDLKQSFYNAGVIYTLSKEEISAKIAASFLFEKDVAIYLNDLCRYSDSAEEDDIIQYRLKKNSKALEFKYNDLFFFLKEKYNVVLIGFSRFDQRTNKEILYRNPSENVKILAGDELILICNNFSRAKIEEEI